MEKTNNPNSNLRNKYQLTENRIGILIIIVTIFVSEIVMFETEITRPLSQSYPDEFFNVLLIIPGVISALLFTIFTKNKIKIFGIGILTIVLWYIWIIIRIILTVRII